MSNDRHLVPSHFAISLINRLAGALPFDNGSAAAMTFRIERLASDDMVILEVSGDIAGGRQTELRALLHAETDPRRVTVDLAAVTRVDLDGAALLNEYEARGATLRNVPAYARARIIDLREEKHMAVETTRITEHEGTVTSSDGTRLFHRSWQSADQ